MQTIKFIILVITCLGMTQVWSQDKQESFHYNDDGSMTILNPQFSYVGRTKGISRNSDLNGVCKLYNQDFVMSTQTMEYDESGSTETVRINSDGRISSTNAGYFPISLIICSNENARPYPSTLADTIEYNSDGSVTIINPQFGSRDFQRGIARNSNLDGVCILFGFTAARNATLEYKESGSTTTARIGSDGRVNQSNAGYFAINFLMCDQDIARPRPSRSGQMYRNDDGSVSILAPYFGNTELTKRGISRNSDLNGVCKYFGYNHSVAMEHNQSGATNTYRFNSDGKVIESNAGYFAIELLVCRN